MENQTNKVKNTDLIKEMASDEFIEFCRDEIVPSLYPLEEKRKLYLCAAWITGIIGVFACLYLAATLLLPTLASNSADKGNAFAFSMQMILVTVGLFWSLVVWIVKKYKNQAKEEVFEKLFSYWGTFKYYPKKNRFEAGEDVYAKNENYIQDLALFSAFNRYKCDDYISGKYNGLDMEIQELDLKYVTGSGKNRREVQIFQGVLVVSSCNKKFNGSTVIKTDSGILNAVISVEGMQRVKLEDPVFERLFEVYSTDQIEARYLLTTAFMDRLVKIACKSKNFTLTCSFENGRIHFAFTSSKDWFEIPIHKPVTDIRNYQAILLELASILSVADALRLDENLGM